MRNYNDVLNKINDDINRANNSLVALIVAAGLGSKDLDPEEEDTAINIQSSKLEDIDKKQLSKLFRKGAIGKTEFTVKTKVHVR